jgi:hypothetical protein
MLLIIWLFSVAVAIGIGAYRGRTVVTSLGLGLFLGPIGVVSLLLSPAHSDRLAGR